MNLKKDLKNSEYVGWEPPKHTDGNGLRKDGTARFHKLKNNNKEFLIAEDQFGKKKYYMSKKLEDDSISQPIRVGTESSPNGIINDSAKNFKPAPIQNNLQKPPLFGDWLEELKKKRFGK